MRPRGRKSIVVMGTVSVLVALFLAGCPLVVHAPRVTIVKGEGQQVGISLSLVAGATLTLQAQSTSSDDAFSWTSSAPDVTTVDASGLVTAVAPGTAVITVTGLVSLASASVEVRVSPNTAGEGEGEGEGELVRMTPFSGRFGYGLEGPYGFVGSLTKQELTDPNWHLEGDFSFPTAGYIVEEPIVRVLESYPEQVRVSIGVVPPPTYSVVAQVITHTHVSVDISASNEAQFVIHVLTHRPPAPGEVSWIPGELSPPAWSIGPPNPMQGDVIYFSGPAAVYQNACHALETLGQPQVHVDPSSRQIQLTFSPVNLFAPCGDKRDPVCGIEGRFGPLEKGDWIFYGQHPTDPLVNFDISFHVGPSPPPLEVHWIPGETGPRAWTIEPARPAARDVIHFSGPTAVYSNACVALTTVGGPHIVIDPEMRVIELAFGPPPMMPCTDLWEPVCGLEGVFGPLPEGDWVFFGQNPQDERISFKIPFHVGPPGPGQDEHVKPIADDADGDFVTDAEENALQRDPRNPDENGNGIPDGVELAHDLLAQVERMPECGGDPAVGGVPPEPGPCKTVFLVRCTEPCAICGEPYNCGHVEITNPDAQAAGEAPFPLTFAALHYMQHGSSSFKWNGAAYDERVDILGLLRALGPPPSLEMVHLCEYLPLAVGNAWEYKPRRRLPTVQPPTWNSPLDVLYPVEVIDYVVTQDMELWALSNGAFLAYANGFLNAFLTDSGGATSPPGPQPPLPLFPERVPIGVPIDVPILGKTVAHRGPLAVMLERFTDLTIQDFPLGDQPDAIAFVAPDAAGVAGQVVIFARDLGLVYLRCPDQNTPTLIPSTANGLVLNSATIQGNESCPKPPPMNWIPDGQCPAEWAVDPQHPTSKDRIQFVGPTGTFGNDCEAIASLGVPHLVIDAAQHTVELEFEPLPEPVFCPQVFAPVCGLQGAFGPLAPGEWVFFAQSAAVTFNLSFAVSEPSGLDPHLVPVPGDRDGDYLSDNEEQQLERNPENPDENANGIPDGVDLARRLARRIEELPWFNAAGDPQYGLNPPELEQQFPTDRPYVISFDYLLDCIWICPVCHEAVPLGHLQIVNPAIHASWREGFRIPLSAWHFLRHTSLTFPAADCGASEEGRIDVVGLVHTLAADPVNRVEVQWIPGETGPKEWTVEILPLGMPLNGIRIAGPTQIFGNACEGEVALGGRPFIVMDVNAHALILVVDGLAPQACAEIYAPVCGLEARIIGIVNGVWTFSAPMLNPPVQLTFTNGATLETSRYIGEK